MDDDLKHYLDQNFARIDERFVEIDVRLAELETRLNDRIEQTETKLLTAFHGRTYSMRRPMEIPVSE